MQYNTTQFNNKVLMFLYFVQGGQNRMKTLLCDAIYNPLTASTQIQHYMYCKGRNVTRDQYFMESYFTGVHVFVSALWLDLTC